MHSENWREEVSESFQEKLFCQTVMREKETCSSTSERDHKKLSHEKNAKKESTPVKFTIFREDEKVESNASSYLRIGSNYQADIIKKDYHHGTNHCGKRTFIQTQLIINEQNVWNPAILPPEKGNSKLTQY